jgi:hypothetical protein
MEPPEKGTRILMTAPGPVKPDLKLITTAQKPTRAMRYNRCLYLTSAHIQDEENTRYRAQLTQRVASGMASNRASPIDSPQLSQAP